MIDMIPFLIVLLIALVGFSVSSLALEDTVDSTIIESLATNYRVMFGDFATDAYHENVAKWVLFICASTLMALVMLNMLVAVMSDTYARVMNDIIPKDFSELNNIILEQEEIMIWNRKKGKAQFLHFATYLEKEEKDEWEGQAQALIKSIQGSNGNDPKS